MQIIDENTVLVGVNGPIAKIVINRPHALNALNSDVLQGLSIEFAKLSRNDALRVVVVTGAGEKAFVAGADIAMMSQLGPRPIADYIELGQRVMRQIETFPVPVIAAVNGFALGGGLELALACDIIVASKAARLGQPEVNLGIIPGFGGTQRLIARCGVGTAKRLVYTGDMVGADEAFSLGLVDCVVDSEELLKRVHAMAETIAAKGPRAVKKAKEVINAAGQMTLLAGLRGEVNGFLELFDSADREEGMTAFLQKRPAVYTQLPGEEAAD